MTEGGFIGAIPNTAVRWTTTVNYDLLFFSGQLRVVRGYSLRDRAAYDKVVGGNTKRERIISFNKERIESAARMTPDEIRDYDPGNCIINVDAIESADLHSRWGICTLRLRLSDGAKLKYKWMNSAMVMSFDETRDLIDKALPGKLAARS